VPGRFRTQKRNPGPRPRESRWPACPEAGPPAGEEASEPPIIHRAVLGRAGSVSWREHTDTLAPVMVVRWPLPTRLWPGMKRLLEPADAPAAVLDARAKTCPWACEHPDNPGHPSREWRWWLPTAAS